MDDGKMTKRVTDLKASGAIMSLLIGVCTGLAQPKLAPVLNVALDEGQSVVHCPTLNMVWDRLKERVGGPIAMQRPDDLVRLLNARMCW